VKSIQFAGGHVFTYSARPGTAAASMPDQVPYTIRKERNALMQAVFKESSQAYQASFLNRTLPVLWESATPLDEQYFEMSGLTGNYLRVNAQTSHNLWNQITPACLNVPVNGFIKGTILQE